MKRSTPVVIAVFTALTAVTAVIAYFGMFSGFSPYDDEGTILVSLKLFLARGGLYDRVEAQYGPFFYELWSGVFGVLRIPIGHDAGRACALIAWLVTSLEIGIVIRRLAGSIVLGAVAQTLTFSALFTVVYEPLHPGNLICLLLASMVLSASFASATLLGAIAAALLFMKVNVGGFAIASLALVAAAINGSLASRRWLRPMIELGFVTLPWWLMAGRLAGNPSLQRYAAHVMLAALGVVAALRAGNAEPAGAGIDLRRLAAGFVAVAAVVTALAFATGTSLGGLVSGMVLKPAGQPGGFSIPLQLADRTMVLDVLSAAAALAYAYCRRRRRQLPALWTAPLAALMVVVGAAMALSPMPQFGAAPSGPGDKYLGLLAFVWVALVTAPGPSERMALARRLLVALAVLQALHAFPVAGSQLGWASFLLVPTGLLIVADRARVLSDAFTSSAVRALLYNAGRVLGVLAVLLVAQRGLWVPLRQLREAHDAMEALDLPGSRWMRVPAEDARPLRDVTAAIEQRCGGFLTLPGMSSFYLWTRKDPPSRNPAGYLTLFGDEEQRRVVAAVEGQADLCLLTNDELAVFWTKEQRPAYGPLLDFMRHEFVPSQRFGAYELWTRRTAGTGDTPAPGAKP